MLDSFSSGFCPAPRDQNFIRRRRFPRCFPNTVNLIPAQQNRLARRTVNRVSRKPSLVVTLDVFAEMRKRDAAVRRERRGKRSKDPMKFHLIILSQRAN